LETILGEMGMTKKGTSKVYKHLKCDTMYISVPALVASDSTFPFKKGDRVHIEIKGESLKIWKVEE